MRFLALLFLWRLLPTSAHSMLMGGPQHLTASPLENANLTLGTLLSPDTVLYGTIQGYLPRPVRMLKWPYYVDGQSPGSIVPLLFGEALQTQDPRPTFGDDPMDLAWISPDRLIVLHRGSRDLALFHAPSLHLLDMIPTGSDAQRLLLVESLILVACLSGRSIYQYEYHDDDHLEAGHIISTHAPPIDMTADLDGRRVYVVYHGSYDVGVFEVQSLTAFLDATEHLLHPPLHEFPLCALWHPTLSVLVITTMDGSIQVRAIVPLSYESRVVVHSPICQDPRILLPGSHATIGEIVVACPGDNVVCLYNVTGRFQSCHRPSLPFVTVDIV